MADETPDVELRRGQGPEALPHGAAAELNRVPLLFEEFEAADAELPDDEVVFTPANDDERFLFSPSDLPDEPVTAGAPFGEGPDFARLPYESDRDFMGRIATELARQPSVPEPVRRFLARLQRGE